MSEWCPPSVSVAIATIAGAVSDTGVCCSGVPHLTATVCVGCASVCGVWGNPPTALAGGDSSHQFTEGDTSSSLLHCSHHLEEGGSVDWRGWG